MVTNTRTLKDSLGAVDIPADKLWGAQTQRSLIFFNIGRQTLPYEFLHALVTLKKACCIVNHKVGILDDRRYKLIVHACERILHEDLWEHFPVKIWQTGSGTQTNMNANEVIANLANTIDGQALDSKQPVHPNDHVNMSQSSNDVFPTVMHMHAIHLLQQIMLPAIIELENQLTELEKKWRTQPISGRTHLMDAIPLMLGQIFSAYRYQLLQFQKQITSNISCLSMLAIGGSAVGNGANTPREFDSKVCYELSILTGIELVSHPNKFAALSAQDEIAQTTASIAHLSSILNKLANDVRILASGPNTGFGELSLPANEPGSSMMPGKVNPTQCEALSMVCIQTRANCNTILEATGLGQMQLNTYRPLIVKNYTEAIELLSDSIRSFTHHCLAGIEINTANINQHIDRNLMLITLAAPEIGYDNATQIAHYANKNNCDIYSAAKALQIMPDTKLRHLINTKLFKLGHNQ